MGSRAFINSQTGRFLRHDHLGIQLAEFVDHSSAYQPREWALRNDISCYGSTATLNHILKQQARAAGEDWTVDLVPHAWQFDPVLIRPADFERLRPSYMDIERQFGIRLGLQYTGG